jgi:hypothetical protein
MRNFHQIGQNVQVFPIMHAVMRRKDLWNLNNARTATPNSPHREANDIWLRYCDVTPESTVESVINDHKTHCFPAWSELPEVRPVIFDLMRSVNGIELGRVIITHLGPGKRIYPHSDSGSYAKLFERYHVLLQSDNGCVFKCGGEEVTMKTADVWWLDNTQVHEVVNNSGNDRYSLIVDIRCHDDYRSD